MKAHLRSTTAPLPAFDRSPAAMEAHVLRRLAADLEQPLWDITTGRIIAKEAAAKAAKKGAKK